jgi:hypothetical protein
MFSERRGNYIVLKNIKCKGDVDGKKNEMSQKRV